MRVLAVAVVAVGIAFGSVSTSWALWGFGEKKKEEPVSQAAPASGQEQKAADSATKAKAEEPTTPVLSEKELKAREATFKAKMEQVAKVKQELNNTEWVIELTPMSGKGKKETDSVIFRDNKISLPGYQKKGFATTNYSVNFQNDLTVWETMQTSEKAGVTFLRGELDQKMTTMRGVLSHKIDEGNTEDFSYVSTGKKAVGPAPVSAPEPTPAPTPAPVKPKKK